MSTLTLLLTGLCDQPLVDLQGLTPLQKAQHPTLDALAANHNVQWLELGKGAQMETAFLRLLGLEAPQRLSLAPLEALFLGHPLEEEEVAVGVRFVSMGQEVVIETADELLSDQEGALFSEALQQFLPEMEVSHLYGPRAVVVGKEPGWERWCSGEVWNPIATIGQRWDVALENSPLLPKLQKATAMLANHEVNLLREELEEPLVNGLIFGEGGRRETWISPTSEQCRWQFYSAWPSMLGLARSLGLEICPLPQEPYRFANVEALLQTLPSALTSHERVIVDIPYLWQSTYKGGLLEKLKTLEWLDTHWLLPVCAMCEEQGHQLQLLPLCCTDIRAGLCVSGKVPLIRGPRSEAVRGFDETWCKEVQSVPQ